MDAEARAAAIRHNLSTLLVLEPQAIVAFPETTTKVADGATALKYLGLAQRLELERQVKHKIRFSFEELCYTLRVIQGKGVQPGLQKWVRISGHKPFPEVDSYSFAIKPIACRLAI